MLPQLSANDSADVRLAQAATIRDCLLGLAYRIGREHVAHDLFRDFGCRVSDASAIRAVNYLVSVILQLGSPGKIFWAVIRWIAVGEVPAFHPFGARANERFQDEPMDEPKLPAWEQVNVEVSARRGVQLAALPLMADTPATVNLLPATPHGAIVADAITWEANDRAVLDGRMAFRHGRSPEKTVVFRATERRTSFRLPVFYVGRAA